jgi:flavorubredoxin
METKSDEVVEGIYRFSTFIPEVGIPFNQYLVTADEPLLFHTGMRGLFPLVSEAVGRVMPLDRLRWISFGHYEADECGAMNDWLAVAPDAQVAHSAIGVMVSIDDQATRPARPLQDGEVLDLGGKRVRHLYTPHVPHAWDAGVMYEETTNTLLCGDLFGALGEGSVLSSDDPVGPAMEAEAAFHPSSITPNAAPTLRRLAELAPSSLAMMHGPVFQGDGRDALERLADAYAGLLAAAAEQ